MRQEIIDAFEDVEFDIECLPQEPYYWDTIKPKDRIETKPENPEDVIIVLNGADCKMSEVWIEKPEEPHKTTAQGLVNILQDMIDIYGDFEIPFSASGYAKGRLCLLGNGEIENMQVYYTN